MADDLDTLLRAAMKTLDEQVPSGYFEALPNQTLARLEGSMNQGPSGTTTRDQVAPPPQAMTLEPDTTPVAKQEAAPAEREEDSGLHDIRNLAQSTKQRLSKKAITNAPPIDSDVLASSSGSFKNIALPQPARMVSLPEIDELPSKKEVLAAEKAAQAAEKSSEKPARKSTKEKKPEAVEAVPAIKTDLVAMPAPAAAIESQARSSFSLPSQQRKSSKGPILAILGAGVAAAAGYVIFMQVNKGEDKSAASQSAPAAKADTATIAAPGAGSAAVAATPPPPAPTVEPIPAEAPKDEAAAGAAAPAQIATDNEKAAETTPVETKAAHHAGKGSKTPPKAKVEKDQNQKEETPKPADTSKTDAKKPTKTAGAGSGEEGEPSFDALLKEAGVQDKKEAKPKLEKKSLTGDDFKTGMSSVEGKAKACYKGTQGTALVKLTVGPTGKITKIAVAGEFSGKPEAMCIAAALRGATFPPWDGGPQSFTYAVLLSD